MIGFTDCTFCSGIPITTSRSRAGSRWIRALLSDRGDDDARHVEATISCAEPAAWSCHALSTWARDEGLTVASRCVARDASLSLVRLGPGGKR
ncbi:MAG: hypothetical protein JWP63_1926 [Candidatus Solibacter sp.]|nr:hypothetical protein [Candidatus Solibacter sp.]